ncbi:hypothetical protein [Amycolatopsis sp. Poz14]|uniref:hypothetical protein n=1 Tax=Amycolatopsis sp. Poz14 TaxID=1447705 RepID=UPI001EE7D08B|nr:hypothetical protein [Amycolatopsis sp. Poz14]MCG3755815.1 hypothetical protein [Amycolatopsis sp. Poz14]
MSALQDAVWVVGLVGGGGLAGWIGRGMAKVGSYRELRRARKLRCWSGYINRGMIASWYVRLVEEPTTPTARVVLEVCQGGPDGKPDLVNAHTMRERIKTDKMLARVPTTSEYEFLADLHKQRGYGRDPDAQPIH